MTFNWAWWNMPLILALGRQRQEDLCEFKASLVYRMSSRLAETTGRPCPKKSLNCIHKCPSIYWKHQESYPCKTLSFPLPAVVKSSLVWDGISFPPPCVYAGVLSGLSWCGPCASFTIAELTWATSQLSGRLCVLVVLPLWLLHSFCLLFCNDP